MAQNIRYQDADQTFRQVFQNVDNAFHVEVNGSASGDGTRDNPVQTINQAISLADPGSKATFVLGPGLHQPDSIINESSVSSVIKGCGSSTRLDLTYDVNFSTVDTEIRDLDLVGGCVLTVQSSGSLDLINISQEPGSQIIASGAGTVINFRSVDLDDTTVQSDATGTGDGHIGSLTVGTSGTVTFNGRSETIDVGHNGVLIGSFSDVSGGITLEGDTEVDISVRDVPSITINEGGSGTGSSRNGIRFREVTSIAGDSGGDNTFIGDKITSSDVHGNNNYRVSIIDGLIDNTSNPGLIKVDGTIGASGELRGPRATFKGETELGAILTEFGAANYVDQTTGRSISRSSITQLSVSEPDNVTASKGTISGANTITFTPGSSETMDLTFTVPENYTIGRQIKLQFNYITTATGGTANGFNLNRDLLTTRAIPTDSFADTTTFSDSPIANDYVFSSIDVTDLTGNINATPVGIGNQITVNFTHNGPGTNQANFDRSSFIFVDGC